MAYRISTGNSFLTWPYDQKQKIETVKCMHKAHIAGFWHNVTLLWSKNLMNYSLIMSLDSVISDRVYTCKIELKSWRFWRKKGRKRFEIDGSQMEVYWDLRSAKFLGNSPEPRSNYYIALVSQQEVVLFLGDNDKKGFKRTKAGPPLVESVMLYKKEHVFNKKSFSTRAKFDQKKREHDIVVESSISELTGPEMWITIDGAVLVHVKNLQWKFRGNQTVEVNRQPVQVFWDVHPWLFCNPGSKPGLFIFKPGRGMLEADSDTEDDTRDDKSDCSGLSKYYSMHSPVKVSQFCLFLHAWKIE